MPVNNSIFNRSNDALYTQLTNTYSSPDVQSPTQSDASKSGNLYLATATNSASLGLLGGSVVITLSISNQSASKTVYLSSLSGGVSVPLSLLSSLSGTATLVKGGTISSPTTVVPVNANFTSTNTSAMTVRSSTSALSGGTTLYALPLVAGQFSFDYAGSLIIPPSNSIALTVSAALSVAGLLTTTANLSWWEY